MALANPAGAGTIARPDAGDSLLDAGPTTPCAARPDYAAGIDATGQAVAPADVAAPPMPVPESIAVPLRGGRARQAAGQPGDAPYIALDGRKLAPLLNPPPCR